MRQTRAKPETYGRNGIRKELSMKKYKKSRFKRRERLVGLLFVAPICLKVLIFTFFFMIYSLYMSFTDWSILAGTKNWVGLAN